MNLWQKITIGAKFLFGGFESATDYALTLLNKLLASADTADKVQKCRATATAVLGYAEKYAEYCPAKWQKEYTAVLSALNALNGALADNALSAKEVEDFAQKCKAAIDCWMKD